MKILVLNSGSSSQKSALYEISGALPEHPPAPAWQGQIQWDGKHAEIQVQNSTGANRKHRLQVQSRHHAIEELLSSLWSGDARVVSAASEIDVAGHRIVHGPKDFEQAIVLTPARKSSTPPLTALTPP